MSTVLQKAPSSAPSTEEVNVRVEVTPQVAAMARTAGALVVAQSYEVDCPEVAQALSNDMRSWAKRIDQIEAMKKDLLGPVKKALDDMREKLSGWFDPAVAELRQARELGAQKLLAWQKAEDARVAEENRKRDEEARRVRQEAERKAAEERAKAEEAARIERERAAAAEDERKRAEDAAAAARAAGDAEAAREADKIAKEKAAEAAKAAEKERQALENGAARAQTAEVIAAASAPAPVVEAPKIAGVSVKETWVAELAPGETEDSAKLKICKAIAEGRIDLLAVLSVDTGARGPLNGLARAQKGLFSVPGYKAVKSTSLSGARK